MPIKIRLSLLAACCIGASAWAAGPAPTPCPSGLPEGTACQSGQDEAGALYWIAVPAGWNREVLVVHSHGGPELGPPKLERSAEDLRRWSVMLRAGYAWAGSTYRQGGVAVRSAAEDTERVRAIAVAALGKPRLTLLHGQSWGASVAAITAETYPQSFDGVLLTSGVLGGGSLSYQFRLDLRVLWQALCHNHPRPDEPAYPLWQGLPVGSKLTRAELNRRVDECTGIARPAGERTPQQAAHLKTLSTVLRTPERALAGHLAWATFHFQDIVFQRLGGRNPFGNEGVRYSGSADDEALNARVLRYKADPAAVAAFAADADPTGRFEKPVLSLHASGDPVAFVELQSTFRDTVAQAGRSALLVQAYTSDQEHSYWTDVQYVAAVQALRAWVERGDKPTPQALAERCTALEAQWGAQCRYLPAYQPGPLSSRVPAR